MSVFPYLCNASFATVVLITLLILGSWFTGAATAVLRAVTESVVTTVAAAVVKTVAVAVAAMASSGEVVIVVAQSVVVIRAVLTEARIVSAAAVGTPTAKIKTVEVEAVDGTFLEGRIKYNVL